MRIKDFTHFDRILIFIIGAMIVLQFPINLSRLAGVGFFQSDYFLLMFALVLALAMLNLVISIKSPLRETQFLGIMILFNIWIFAMGIIESNNDAILGIRYFIFPFFVYLLLIGREFPIFFYVSSGFWKIVLLGHALGILYFYGNLIGRVYPGIGVQSVAYAAIFFLINRNPVLAGISILLIVLEGKRSILLSLMITFIFLRLVKLNVAGRLIYSIFGGILISAILVIALLLIADMEGTVLINRINDLNPFSDRYDIFLGTSGRLGEIVSFFGNQSLGSVLIGSGSGFEYEWALGYDSAASGEEKGYLHMSALNYIAAGGMLGAITFYYMACLPFKASNLTDHLQIRTTAFGLGLFSIIQSFSGFSLSTDAISLLFIICPALINPAASKLKPRKP